MKFNLILTQHHTSLFSENDASLFSESATSLFSENTAYLFSGNNQKGVGCPIGMYDEISQELSFFETEIDNKYLFQVNLIKPTKCCMLNNHYIHDILKGVELLNKLSQASSRSNLESFKEVFCKRYGDSDVPLLEALDPEMGIGYLQNRTYGDYSPLVDDINLETQTNNLKEIIWNRINAFLHDKFITCISNKKYHIEITDEEIKDFDINWEDLPDTFSVSVNFIGTDENQKCDLILRSAGGASASNLLSRFCQSDEQISSIVSELISKEELLNRDVIFAEIIHLPEARTGNILLRPNVRKYEIPYLAKSSLSNNYQIMPSDLVISFRNNRIELRSEMLKKKIIPRLGSAHNFSSNALPVYQFLCDLQTQNMRPGVWFNWNPILIGNRFLPRVFYKNMIISRATWNFTTSDIQHLFKTTNDSSLNLRVNEFRLEYNIPERVVLIESDNELFLNLTNNLCIKIWLSVVKNKPRFQLKEFLFSGNNTIVNSIDGSFTNEFIFSFYKNHL